MARHVGNRQPRAAVAAGCTGVPRLVGWQARTTVAVATRAICRLGSPSDTKRRFTIRNSSRAEATSRCSTLAFVNWQSGFTHVNPSATRRPGSGGRRRRTTSRPRAVGVAAEITRKVAHFRNAFTRAPTAGIAIQRFCCISRFCKTRRRHEPDRHRLRLGSSCQAGVRRATLTAIGPKG